MNVNLPVKIYDKCVHIPFDIEINNNLITIIPNHESKIHNIILCSESYGIITIPICFPLIFHIINNELVSDLFYIFYTLSSDNEIDFINQLLIQLNTFKLYKNINISNLINILKLHNNDINEGDIIHKNYNRLIKYINFCLFVMADNITNISNNSKIIHIINLIKKIKINFYGNNTTIEEHINFINNPKLIIKKRYYFYECNNKIIRKLYEQFPNNKIDITPYPKKYSELINIKNLLNHLIINKFDLLLDCASKILFKKNIEVGSNIINVIINNCKDSIYELEKINNCINNNYLSDISFEKFKELDLITININNLYDNNIYPINFDKRTLNKNFAKLLFYYFNINSDVHINQKMKSIIIFIIKMYKLFMNNEITIINNNRIYNESMLYNIIKILLFNDTFNLFINIPDIEIIRNKFIINTMIIHILNNLSWKTISKQLAVFKYIISNKDECKELILVDGKVNKVFTSNMDNRLKKIIIEPSIMFNYLKKEEDFYKWIINFKDQTIKIFYNMINLDDEDYIKLSKILFHYSKIKNQSMNDNNYKKLLNLLKMNNKIILFNDRINIKFKEVFKNININLGFLARDIVNEETISITISESSDYDELHKLKKKYYKYKGKYLEMKYTENTTDII